MVPVNGDTLDEPSETFFVDLSNATNGVLIDRQGQGTIADNDPAPSLSINDASATEGDAGTTTATFTVTDGTGGLAGVHAEGTEAISATGPLSVAATYSGVVHFSAP